jgi:3-hydroxyisobutyrate dehydrogenase-like beta-hydroxyacid dehydrogenase
MRIGIVHPGAMGTSLGAALVGNGHDVRWASHGRSDATRTRAAADGLVDVGHLSDLVAESEMIISVCPPGEAAAVAGEIAGHGYVGDFLDANAIAPSTARGIAAALEAGGATFVDGGIVGPPARHRGLTVLYLSGDPDGCARVTESFAGSALDTHLVDGPAGAASAVKMAFAAWTKGTSALLLAIAALAEVEGVTAGLEHAWSVLTPDLAARLPATAAGTAPKAWRFVGEMEEIASTFADAGLPSGFHLAAAEIYTNLRELRDRDGVTIDEVMALLAQGKPS